MLTGHRTKAEKKIRSECEKKLQTDLKIVAFTETKNNIEAYKIFRSLKKIYNQIEFVDGCDNFTINRYCVLSAECKSIELQYAKVEKDIDEAAEVMQRIDLYKILSNFEFALNKKRDMLLKLEDRMFLNPASRIKSVPKKPKEDAPKSKFDKFVKSG